MHRPSLEKGVFELIIDEESSPFCLIVLILDEVTFVQLESSTTFEIVLGLFDRS